MVKKVAVFVMLLALCFPLMGSAKPVAKKRSTAHPRVVRTSVTHKVPHKPTAVTRQIHTKPVVKKPTGYVSALVQRLAALKALWPKAMDGIKAAYRELANSLTIKDYKSLVAMTKPTKDSDGNIVEPELVQIPSPEKYNIKLRVSGRGAIGEADRIKGHDRKYYQYTRPYVAGAMIDLGSQLKHAKLDVPGVTRTVQFQGWLQHGPLRALAALTDFPSHAFAIAYDVGLLNTPIDDVDEIIAKAVAMRDAGKILINPEAYQSKCLHIVPAPEYQAYFESVYEKAAAEVAANH